MTIVWEKTNISRFSISAMNQMTENNLSAVTIRAAKIMEKIIKELKE